MGGRAPSTSEPLQGSDGLWAGLGKATLRARRDFEGLAAFAVASVMNLLTGRREASGR
jgi:hypothetical protein